MAAIKNLLGGRVLALFLAGSFLHGEESATLTIAGAVIKPLKLTLAELREMPATKISAQDRDGASVNYTGLPFHELLRRAGVPLDDDLRDDALTLCVLVKAADGYQAVFSLAELDPSFQRQPVLLAYRRDGAELNEKVGPLRLVVPGDQRKRTLGAPDDRTGANPRRQPKQSLKATMTRMMELAAVMAGLVPAHTFSSAQATLVSINPEADAFVRELAPTQNYGRAGLLSVSGIGATNGFGVPSGRTDSIVRFRLGDVIAALNSGWGADDWSIASAGLQLYEMGAPNNPIFNRGVGAFEVRWLATGDSWLEGTGSPNIPTTDGITFRDLPLLIDPPHDISLGYFTNRGTNGPLVLPLLLPREFSDNLRSGTPTTLHFVPASEFVGFTFLSRSDPRIEWRMSLQLTVTPRPQPRITSIINGASGDFILRFYALSNWMYQVQYNDLLSPDGSHPWLIVSNVQALPFDAESEVRDSARGQQRFYRLWAVPPSVDTNEISKSSTQ